MLQIHFSEMLQIHFAKMLQVHFAKILQMHFALKTTLQNPFALLLQHCSSCKPKFIAGPIQVIRTEIQLFGIVNLFLMSKDNWGLFKWSGRVNILSVDGGEPHKDISCVPCLVDFL